MRPQNTLRRPPTSRSIPTRGQPISMTTMPAANAAVPLIDAVAVKRLMMALCPRQAVAPDRNSAQS